MGDFSRRGPISKVESMSVLRVDDGGLQGLAALCADVAVRVGELLPTSTPGPINQATSAAVVSGNTAVAAVSTTLAARAALTGHKAETAAAAYASHESRSGEKLAALGSTIEI